MKKNLHIISKVLPDSIGEELELEPGDALLSINGQPVEDVFDYRYLMNDEFVSSGITTLSAVLSKAITIQPAILTPLLNGCSEKYDPSKACSLHLM